MARQPKGKLSERQALFVQEYLKDLNATQAAIRAGYVSKHADVRGAQLLRIGRIKEAVDKAIAKRSERTKIDADWVLERLAREAEADVNDLYNSDGSIKPVKEWPLIWRQGLVQGIDTAPDGTLKLKLSDRVKRLEMLGKHVGVQAFKDRVEHEGNRDAPLVIQVVNYAEQTKKDK